MKKVCSIVLALCVLTGLCVGLSLSGAADVTLPAKPTDANNYAAPVAVSGGAAADSNSAVDNGDGTYAVKGIGLVSTELAGLKATDDYVVSVRVMNFASTHAGFNPRIYLAADKSIELRFQPKMQLVSPAGATDTAFTAVNGITAAYTFQVYAQYDAATATRDYHVFVDGTFRGTIADQAATAPYLAVTGRSQHQAVITVSGLDAYNPNGDVTTTTTTTTTSSTATSTTTSSTTGETTTTTQKPTGIVDGVDLDKKGTGKDVEILAPGDAASKNLIDWSKAELADGLTANNGTVILLKGKNTVSFDLSAIKAADDYIIKFTTAPPTAWPHDALNVIFGKNESGEEQVFVLKGNHKDAAPVTNYPSVYYQGTSQDDAGSKLLCIEANTVQEVTYTIYVTTSVETGKRRIFFFANGKALTELNDDGTVKPLVIEDQDVMTPCLSFVGLVSVDHARCSYPLSNVQAYVAKAPVFKEALVDKEYKTAPIAKPGAKNYVDLSKATAKGNAAVDAAAGKLMSGSGDDSSVTIPLAGLKKTDNYVISLMTTACSYDDWQTLNITFAQNGNAYQKIEMRGSTAYASMEINGEETRLAPTAVKGDMTKIDILVTTSVETGKRRIVIFQDGKPLALYSDKTKLYDNKTAEFLNPTLVLSGGTNASFEVTGLKVFKLTDAKGETNGSASTGNASKAITAVAVTAAIALPIVFVAKKRKEEA